MSDVPRWYQRDIVAPANADERSAVRLAQRVLRVPVTGEMDTATTAALRGIQELYGIPRTGTLDKRTACVIDSMRPYSPGEE